mmetsp:Transcript_49610/g.97757  ORF Transcript_49610/g.97757 Transcript_49610/m.97757 type:complete len:208 (-) Transcript_49610:115-738(-)
MPPCFYALCNDHIQPCIHHCFCLLYRCCSSHAHHPKIPQQLHVLSIREPKSEGHGDWTAFLGTMRDGLQVLFVWNVEGAIDTRYLQVGGQFRLLKHRAQVCNSSLCDFLLIASHHLCGNGKNIACEWASRDGPRCFPQVCLHLGRLQKGQGVRSQGARFARCNDQLGGRNSGHRSLDDWRQEPRNQTMHPGRCRPAVLPGQETNAHT